MTAFTTPAHILSVTEAASRGVSKLVRSAEHGENLVVQRHGQSVAAVVSMQRLEQIEKIEEGLRDSLLVLARLGTDTGERTDLTEVIEQFGFDKAELEAELDNDLTSDSELVGFGHSLLDAAGGIQNAKGCRVPDWACACGS